MPINKETARPTMDLAAASKGALVIKNKLTDPQTGQSIFSSLIEKGRYATPKEEAGQSIPTAQYIVCMADGVIANLSKRGYQIARLKGAVRIFNGRYWEEVDRGKLETTVSRFGMKIGVPAKVSKIASSVREAVDSILLQTNDYRLGADKTTLLNVQSGTLKIGETVEKQPFNATDELTYVLPYDYDETATAPIFSKYLERCVPEEESRLVFAEYAGYVFLRHTAKVLKIEKALMLLGGGHNGKSVATDVLSALYGSENTTAFSLVQITDKNGFWRSKLEGKLVNISSDEGAGKYESSVLKSLISGETQNVSDKFKDPRLMTDFAKLMFSTNKIAETSDRSEGHARRFIILNFDQEITDAEKDGNLAEKIIAKELPGVLNWAINGLQRLLKNKGFSYSPAVEKAKKDFKLSVNNVVAFYEEEGYVLDLTGKITFKSLYEDYRMYCIESGTLAIKRPNFRNETRAAGFPVEETGGSRRLIVVRVKSTNPDKPF